MKTEYRIDSEAVFSYTICIDFVSCFVSRKDAKGKKLLKKILACFARNPYPNQWKIYANNRTA